MAQNTFVGVRLPQALFDRLESLAGEGRGAKSKILVRAIAAYLDSPESIELSVDNAIDNNNRIVALESRIAELEQQFRDLQQLQF